jgi:hypothetical protein
MKRFTLALVAAVAACTLGLATTASAAIKITPGPITQTFKSAHIALGADAGLEFPGEDPALQGQTVVLTGTVEADGTISAPAGSLQFPTVSASLEESFGLPITLTVGVKQIAAGKGTINPETGAASMNLPLGVIIGVPDAGISCRIDIPFQFGTGTYTVAGTTTVSGGPVLPDGQLSIAAVATLPTEATENEDCNATAVTAVNNILPLLASLDISTVGISLSGTTTGVGPVEDGSGGTPPPGGEGGKTTTTPNEVGPPGEGGGTQTTPGETPPPGGETPITPGETPQASKKAPVISVGKLSKVKKGKAKVKLTCSKAAACSGTITLSYKAKGKKKATRVVRVAYKIAAGKSKTISLKVSKSKLKALKKVKGKASMSVTVKGGKTKTKSVKVK